MTLNPTWHNEFAADDDCRLLAPGRYRQTFDQIANHWAFNDHRAQLLIELRSFVAAVQQVVPIAAIWVGGSYLTSKEHPSDIDVTLTIEIDELDKIPEQRKVLITTEGLHSIARSLNVRVDAYILPWASYDEPDTSNPDHARYLQTRGYWDDWWMRTRGTSHEQRIPRRGYLEVIVDGHSPR